MFHEFNQFDLNLFRVFIKVMQLGSYSQASEALDISQPAVSLAMGRLQKSLDEELFIRGKSSIVPTSAAQSLYKNISIQMLDLEKAFTGFDSFDASNSAYQFSLSLPEDFNPVFLEQLPIEQNTELTFQLKDLAEEESELTDSLRHRTVDLAIDSLLLEDHSINHEWLFDAEIVLVVAKSHPEIAGEMSFEQYQTLPQSILNIKRNNKFALNMFYDEVNLQRNIGHQANSLIANMLIVSRTQFFCHTTKRLATMYQDSLGLQIIEPPIQLKRVPFYMMWHKSNDNSARHLWLRERVKRAARNV